MNKQSSVDWLGIAGILLLLIITVTKNTYLLFGVYGLTLTGALIVMRKNKKKVGAYLIASASVIGIILTLINLIRR